MHHEYVQYTTASNQYSLGKRDKLTLTSYILLMSRRNIHPRSTHPSGLQHIFHAASCRSVGTTKRGHYLLSILYIWYKNYQYQQVLFITYSHHLSPPFTAGF